VQKMPQCAHALCFYKQINVFGFFFFLNIFIVSHYLKFSLLFLLFSLLCQQNACGQESEAEMQIKQIKESMATLKKGAKYSTR